MDEHLARETGHRIRGVAGSVDMARVVEGLTAERDAILERWLEAARAQPFHRDRPEFAVADHIPSLYDALVALLRRDDEAERPPTPPLDDPAVVREAQAHAQARFEQGLNPVAVVTEFRLLRQELSRAMVSLDPGSGREAELVRGLALLSDGLDGATSVGLSALSDRVENLRETFLAMTVHDVRQPLTLMEGSLRLAHRWLESDEPGLPRVRSAVDEAISANAELVAMIDTLSDASRLAMGALEPDPEPVSLSAVVDEVVGSFGETARGRIRVEGGHGERLLGLWDAGMLRRLVANLVGNALKYAPGESAISVSISEHGPGRARLTVVDQGLGMTGDEIESVFGRFMRADRVRQAGIPGLGLGLYTCKGIVEAHGGSIEVRSAGPGQGTTVVVELPLLDLHDIED